MNSSNKKQQCNNKNSSNKINKNQKRPDIGLYNFSYADYVILSSTLSYAIAEELNDADLDILIAFFGMVTSDLAILRTRRGVLQGLNNINDSDEAVIGATESTESAQSSYVIAQNLGRKYRKIRKVKKRKIHKSIDRDNEKKR